MKSYQLTTSKEGITTLDSDTNISEDLSSFESVDLDFKEVLKNCFKGQSIRSKNIISKRFGLSGGDKRTLESIGKYYKITRERVRQIEAATLKEIKTDERFSNLAEIEEKLKLLIEENGGIVEKKYLSRLSKDWFASCDNYNYNIINFVLTLSDEFNEIPEDDQIKPAWSLKNIDTKTAEEVLATFTTLLEEKKSPLKTNSVINKLLAADLLNISKELDEEEKKKNKKVILSYLNLSKKVLKNPFDEWGFTSWRDIVPSGVKDKAYLVLKKTDKPLHFNEITEKINDSNFDKKKAIPQTVHNELIKDSRFVLVGRGIYALNEWGYEPGTVSDVIASILKKEDKPLSKNKIVNLVSKQRIVKKNTILLALQNKQRFQKNSSNEFLVAESE